ncbi:MAG: TIGR00730 family Rossman fold protein [Acidimicrobiia bacterium]|nr:MAG: TIGR00730 family Rossman fold protein [Acidimicrobiia bacterium]
MRSYRIGDEAIDDQISALVSKVVAGHPDHDHNEELVREMIVTSLKLLRDDAGRGDVKLMNAALKEMRYSFAIFQRYRDVPKVTMYGSARTPSDDPNYQAAAEFASRMVDQHRWMVITGAGPGIMEAGNLGAGSDDSFGVNIRLPFEAEANPYVHESRLINYKYFFTRKLAFVKESHAFVLFPGGFGTQDETFELLTLIQTGKSDIHPIAMLEAPGTGYWTEWQHFADTLVEQELISSDDLNLFRITEDVDVAIQEILDFYASYHSQRFVDGDLILRFKSEPSDELVASLNDDFSDILSHGEIRTIAATAPEIATDDNVDLARLRLSFDRRQFGRLRLLIDRINATVTNEQARIGSAREPS